MAERPVLFSGEGYCYHDGNICYDGSIMGHEKSEESLPMQVPSMRPRMAQADREEARTLPELQAAKVGHKVKQKSLRSGDKNPRWKGGRWIHQRGYVFLTTSEGKVLEHRFLMERWLGRKLTSEEVVHHKDGNKQNNSKDNLELMSKSGHAKHHADEKMAHLMLTGAKVCRRCFSEKPVSCFHKNRANRLGVKSACKVCVNLELKKRYVHAR